MAAGTGLVRPDLDTFRKNGFSKDFTDFARIRDISAIIGGFEKKLLTI